MRPTDLAQPRSIYLVSLWGMAFLFTRIGIYMYTYMYVPTDMCMYIYIYIYLCKYM